VRIGNLVKSAAAWGPDKYDDEYYPVGVVYRQHKYRDTRWWVRWVSPAHIAGEPSCELEWDLETLNEND